MGASLALLLLAPAQAQPRVYVWERLTAAAPYPQELKPLTSLRFIAAFWVLLYHFKDHLGLDLGRFGLVAHGFLGVDLFFTLSGFILAHVYLTGLEGGQFGYGGFLKNRIARIYPMHLAALGADARPQNRTTGARGEVRSGTRPGVVRMGMSHDSAGNRRSVGATIHCMHGSEAVVEEILDWRPYDYWSNRSTIGTPAGPIHMLNTVELEPTVSGTTIHFRYAAPKVAKERTILQAALPIYEEIFKASGESIVSQLEEELARRRGDASVEPDLPARKPESVIATIAPME